MLPWPEYYFLPAVRERGADFDQFVAWLG